MSRPIPDELLDLLVSDVTEGLTPENHAALDDLLAEHPQAEADHASWEQTAALAHLALLDSTPGAAERMPDATRARLLVALQTADGADGAVADAAPPASATTGAAGTGRRGPLRDLGWYLAAGIALAWVGTQWLSGTLMSPGTVPFDPGPVAVAPAEPAAPADRREQLLASAADAVTVEWSQTVDGYEQVSGDVVWSNERQEGYMRLAGMPVNDAARSQYQLWIVDPARDEEPVDGGVFDVASSGEVVVPIEAKLEIVSPAAFAITREKPGGVVVSEGPLLVVAAR
jgi:hypothetical protein